MIISTSDETQCNKAGQCSADDKNSIIQDNHHVLSNLNTKSNVTPRPLREGKPQDQMGQGLSFTMGT